MMLEFAGMRAYFWLSKFGCPCFLDTEEVIRHSSIVMKNFILLRVKGSSSGGGG
jgi:hypothetical protein